MASFQRLQDTHGQRLSLLYIYIYFQERLKENCKESGRFQEIFRKQRRYLWRSEENASYRIGIYIESRGTNGFDKFFTEHQLLFPT